MFVQQPMKLLQDFFKSRFLAVCLGLSLILALGTSPSPFVSDVQLTLDYIEHFRINEACLYPIESWFILRRTAFLLNGLIRC
jgi:hypothetical protein